MQDDLPPGVQAVATLVALGAGILLTWWTVVAFIGGTLWPLAVEVEGGVGFGLLWLFVIDPILVTVGGWIFAAVFGSAALFWRQGNGRP